MEIKLEKKSIEDMTVQDAIAWLRPETSCALIGKAREELVSEKEIIRTIDHAIKIVCDIAEKTIE